MSKYRILDTPDIETSKCANCGSCKNDGRKYIDFGLHVDWFGAVFLCGRCLQDIAQSMGLFKQLEDRLAIANDSLLKIRNVQQQGVDLRADLLQTFGEVQKYFADLRITGDDPIPNTSTSVVTESPTTESGTDKVKSGTDATKPRPVKSTSSSGSKNLPSLADLLNESS